MHERGREPGDKSPESVDQHGEEPSERIRGRPAQSSDAQQIVAQGHPLHDPGVAHSPKSGTPTEENGRTKSGVEGILLAGGAGGKHGSEQARLGQLDGVGAGTSGAPQPVRGETKPLEGLRSLKYRGVVRLINSTPMGTVIGEAQFARHRNQALGMFCAGRRADFVGYVAWLVSERHKPRAAAYQGPITSRGVLELVERQEYRCALTGRRLEPTTASLDHVVPLSRGGRHEMENAQVLHKMVNRAKGAMTNEEFIEMCFEVVQWVKRTSKQEPN